MESTSRAGEQGPAAGATKAHAEGVSGRADALDEPSAPGKPKDFASERVRDPDGAVRLGSERFRSDRGAGEA